MTCFDSRHSSHQGSLSQVQLGKRVCQSEVFIFQSFLLIIYCQTVARDAVRLFCWRPCRLSNQVNELCTCYATNTPQTLLKCQQILNWSEYVLVPPLCRHFICAVSRQRSFRATTNLISLTTVWKASPIGGLYSWPLSAQRRRRWTVYRFLRPKPVFLWC